MRTVRRPARPRRPHLRARRGRASAPRLTSSTARTAPGKTNLLEALYFGLHRPLVPDRRTSARSCASAQPALRVELDIEAPTTARTSSPSATSPAQAQRLTRRRRAGRAPARRARSARSSASSCPTAWSSSRARRRCAARISTRSSRRCGPRARAARRAYAQALAQRNALLVRVRAGRRRPRRRCATWDLELGRHALELRDARAARRRPHRARASRRSPPSSGLAGADRAALPPAQRRADRRGVRRRARGAPGRPTSSAASPATARTATTSCSRATAASCAPTARRASSGSALLALLLSERDALADAREDPPLLLLDDVMSELDAERRERLVARVTRVGQVVVTTTDLAHVPDAEGDRRACASRSRDGAVHEEALAG